MIPYELTEAGEAAVAVQTVDPGSLGPEAFAEWITTATDRQLLEFNARKTQGVLDVMQNIHDSLGPALEKLGPMLSMMGLG